ncbi:MAG: hypothetical protein Ta2B_06990 [Termitinemataceae bacterium]|nr:MAG: hypothetical protein Ta2B_06990 [Termitinemataceae bacterium]
MKLSDLLKPELVLLKQTYRTHNDLLDGLIAELYRSGGEIPLTEDVVRKAIMTRETLQGTLLSTGLSIPHSRFEELHDPVIVIGVPESPMPTRGDTPVRMMILMLTPAANSTHYLNILSSFAKISKSELFQKLCSVKESSQFIKIIEEANIDISKEFTVASIMNSTLKVLHPDNTVRQAMDMFRKDRLSYAPVIDNNNKFVGELLMTDLFAICIPNYALKMQNLKFLTHFEPLEDLLRNEDNLFIGDIMKKPTITLDEDSPVVEAVLKFVQTNRRYLPVVKDGQAGHLAGVVGYMDILKKVLRA